ncbi:MAG: alpha/beta fold hydrolase [Bacteriovorax sp.]
MKVIGLLCLAFLSQNLFALSEMNYQNEYSAKVSPLIKKMNEGSFPGENNVPIHFRTYLNSGASNCLVVLPGRTEPIEKYAEVIYDLLQTPAGKNLNFFLMDHRGQGQSGRMSDPWDMGHIDHFDNYVKDLEAFVRLQNLDKRCEHKFLLAHSMGAGIATAYILKNPQTFERVALSSPMLKIMTKPYAYVVARAIVEAQTVAGRGAKFAIGQKGYDPAAKFEENTFTTSPERFDMAMSMYKTYPLAQLGGVSNRWVLEVMKGTNKLRSHYHEISTPMRVFVAGLESYSEPSEMEKLCDEAANCKRLNLPTSKHEVMMDRDINRDQVLKELENFFN